MKQNKERLSFFSQGMTLMEILIVVSLIGIVSLAIYNALVSGLKIFKKRSYKMGLRPDSDQDNQLNLLEF